MSIRIESPAFELLHRAEGPRPAEAGGFEDALGNALAGLEQSQAAADGESAKLAAGGGNLHETMLALEKADVTLRVATRVRNKLVEAYNEVMRMTV